ncbi:uncharacterized protein LOC132203285 [Neocloeon triangulifer]|uniref:uncharacterized protein LOC132203285 n=1 Tax=Neocloeon triangulifer TaxID=2078957 RepID=UPI00286EE8F2|nr:uncharacterized protein LOC132203285 [Neocloeon triangulifer]
MRVRDGVYAAGQPNDRGDCLVAELKGGSVSLISQNCSKTSLKFICEARDTTKASSPGRAILQECGEIYNITMTEIDSLWSSKTFDMRLKCFVKCVGEFGNLILEGQIVTQEMIRIAEQFTMGGDVSLLNKNMEVASKCGNKVGMDECDTASLAFSCVAEEAPDIMQRALLKAEINASAESVGLPLAQSYCRYDVPYGLNFAWRQAYLDENPSPGGPLTRAYYNQCGARNYLLIESNDTTSIGPATRACLEYGLQHVSFETFEELLCVNELFAVPNKVYTLWTSASFMSLADSPVWCATNAPLDISLYPWNLQGVKKFTGTSAGRMFVVVVIRKIEPYLMNIVNSGILGGVLCEGRYK